MELREKSVVITGAGSGIGRALALEFASLGARLTLSGRRREPLEESARLVHERGAVAQVVAGDITDQDARSRVVQAAVDHHGGLDVLVNNAGNVRAGRLEDISVEDIRAQIEVDLLAPILLTREALPALRRSGDAAIVNVSSAIGLVALPFYGPYAAAKAGIAHFGESLRRELHGEGVQVLNAFPGATETPMMTSSKAGPEVGFQYESAEAVAKAIVEGLRQGARDVIRGGDVRRQMIELNRQNPGQLDEMLAGRKDALEAAVRDHRSI